MAASLVIQTAFLGDMVLTTPLIAALARRGPVDVIGTPANLPLLANNPCVRRAIPYDKRAPGRLRSLLAIGRQLRATHRYDAAYLAQGSLRSAALAIVAGVRRRIGFETAGGRHLYTTLVRYDESLHHAERLLRLAAARGIEVETDRRPLLFPGEMERRQVDDLLQRHNAEGSRLVAIAPGSVWNTKRWPFYPELTTQLTAQLAPHGRVVVLGAASDTPLADTVRAAAPSAIDATGALSLLASAELLGRCAALVSNDSAPVHLASAMNTPTVAVFGPTVPAFGFGPVADRNESVGHDGLACRPCDRHGPRRCPLGHWRCMGELSADAVLHALTRIAPELFQPS